MIDKQELEKRLIEVGVPGHIVEGLARYVVEGKPTGSFLRAVLTNDLRGAFQRADDVNLKAIPEIVGAIYWETPIGCNGSPEKVDAWIAKGGLMGLDDGRGDYEYNKKRDDEMTEVEA